jgi:hypothetical protein
MTRLLLTCLSLSLACGGGSNSTAPSFTPELPLHATRISDNNAVALDRTHIRTLVYEVMDSQHRLVPGATVFLHTEAGSRSSLSPSTTEVDPSEATTDADGRYRFVWTYFVSVSGDVVKVNWCLAYRTTCDPTASAERDGTISAKYP